MIADREWVRRNIGFDPIARASLTDPPSVFRDIGSISKFVLFLKTDITKIRLSVDADGGDLDNLLFNTPQAVPLP